MKEAGNLTWDVVDVEAGPRCSFATKV